MGEPCLKDWRFSGIAVDPVYKPRCLSVEAIRGRRLEMDTLAADRTGNDLHGAIRIVAPSTDLNS
jgi:hypothetical protein